MTKTEIWLRFASKEDYDKKEQEVLSLLWDDDEGEEVIVFLADTKKKMCLPRDKRCNKHTYQKLEALLGESNVKVKTETKELERNFYSVDKKEVSLERIADALEEIAESLNNIECNLDACIAQHGNNHFICVTGSINTSGY